MNKIYLYNTLTRKKEELRPVKKGEVGLYTCGPTVYNFAHIGNLRSYIFSDILTRVLLYNGYKVKRVMNITDVGHLAGDRDMGEDKMEKGAKREGKTAWEIAEFYTEAFKKDMAGLNLLPPTVWCKATGEIAAQIDLIKMLEKKDFTYRTSDGIYFDTSKFEGYNKLSHLDLETLKEGARVEKNEEKKNATDFALWKFSPKNAKRQMEWTSPWGTGFPGWHLECSAMSMKYLKHQLDIHTGGQDHINVHHTNEIAQSEAATGKPFFNIWMHGAFLNIVGGKKMAKSEDNFLTLDNAFVKKGIDPLVYRYAALGTHYRKPMEYSKEAMENAAKGYEHLRNQVREITPPTSAPLLHPPLGGTSVKKEYRDKFLAAINDDLNLPQAMAVVRELLKSDLSNGGKSATIMDFDQVLGLNLDKTNEEEIIPENIRKLAEERERARDDKDFDKADKTREQIEKLGFSIEDTSEGIRICKK